MVFRAKIFGTENLISTDTEVTITEEQTNNAVTETVPDNTSPTRSVAEKENEQSSSDGTAAVLQTTQAVSQTETQTVTSPATEQTSQPGTAKTAEKSTVTTTTTQSKRDETIELPMIR